MTDRFIFSGLVLHLFPSVNIVVSDGKNETFQNRYENVKKKIRNYVAQKYLVRKYVKKPFYTTQ